VNWPVSPPPSPVLSEEGWQNLKKLVAALKNSGGYGVSSPVWAAALAPLWAYREEIRNQQFGGQDRTEAVEYLDTVEKGFRAELEELEATE
jgi:hypothetical protein